MKQITTFLAKYPSIAIAIILLAIIAMAIIWMVYRSRRRFHRFLEAAFTDTTARSRFTKRFTPQVLMLNTELIEELVTKNGPEIIFLTGLHEAWIRHFKRFRDTDLLRKMIRYIPEKGLFYCLLAALGKNELARELSKSLNQTVDLSSIRALGLTDEALKISEEQIFRLLGDNLDGLQALASDQEWTNRYFALKLLLCDKNDISREILWKALHDPHYLIRMMILQELETEKREELYQELYNLYLSDPVYKVRKAAADRIHMEFSDLYTVNPSQLLEEQAMHVLELLRPGSMEDENIALYFLKSANLEARLPAASFLEKQGILTRLATEVYLGDRENLERNLKLLENALEVNASSFLSVIETTNNPGTLLLCARILLSLGGLSRWTIALARKTFSLCSDQPELEELYTTALKGLAALGTEEAYSLIDQELKKWRQTPRMMKILLSALPTQGMEYFYKTLADFLEDTTFEPRGSLREALGRMPQFLLLPLLLEKLRGGEGYPLLVKADAVKLLAEKGLPYGLQSIFENIPFFSVDETEDFLEIIEVYPKKEVSLWVGKYLNSGDSLTRTSLIRRLPPEVLGEKNHLQTLKQSLKDPDPDMRIAALRTLVELNEADLLNKESPLVTDPVERVREEYARLLGAAGEEKILKKLQERLIDENESLRVRIAIVQGMGDSCLPIAIDHLIESLDKLTGELQDEIISVLAKKNTEVDCERLLKRFIGGKPEQQGYILASVRLMDDQGLETIIGLLKKRALRPHILQILEESGWMSYYQKLLRDPDQAKRLKAVQALAQIRSIPAYRGLIRRTKEKDEETRIAIDKTLELLKTVDRGLLEELAEDSDWKARRYARRELKGIADQEEPAAETDSANTTSSK